MKPLFLVLLLGLAACVTPPKLAPAEMRQKSYVIENAKSKSENFDKIQTWAAKAGGNVRLNDRQASTIIVRANVDCDALKLNGGYAKDQSLHFILEMKAADKRIDLNFTDLLAKTITASYDSGLRPSSKEEVDTVVAECIEPIKNDIGR